MAMQSVKIELLDRENYDTWKIQAEALLIKNDVWDFVCGKNERPKVDAADTKTITEAATWDKNDSKARADLILSIHPSILKEVKDCKTSNGIWMKLKSIYQSKGPARKATLLKQLILNKMSPTEDMHSYLSRFFDIVNKLSDMDLIINEDLLTILLLYSLPSTYENFRIAIESRDDLPSPENLKIKMIEEYNARKTPEDDIQDAMIAKHHYKHMKYSNNNKPNKSVEFKSNQYNKSNKHVSNIMCYNCRNYGHKAAQCRSKNFKNQKSSVASVFIEKENEAFCVNDDVIEEKFCSFVVPLKEKYEKWCLDSGATTHVCTSENKFTNFQKTTSYKLNLANNETTKVIGKGSVNLIINDGKSLKIDDVLYVPDLRSNLLSVSKLVEKGYGISFQKDGATIMDKSGNILTYAPRINDLYYILEKQEITNMVTSEDKLRRWHELLGHVNILTLKYMSENKVIKGLPDMNQECYKNFVCETCIENKQTRIPFPKGKARRYKRPLELVHSDICGPFSCESLGRTKYFVTFIDDSTRWCEVHTMKNKSDVLFAFKKYKAQAEKQLNVKLKILRTDNAKEYCSAEFNKFLEEEGIIHQLSVEYTPQQNGVAERKNRTLVEMARCMLNQAKLPVSFWAEAIVTANYVQNRCSSRAVDGKIPYTLWHKTKPSLSHLQRFGTIAYMLNKGVKRNKFDVKSQKCIFVGYCENSKAYRLYQISSRKIVKSRDVTFTNQFKDERSLTMNNFKIGDNNKTDILEEMKFDNNETRVWKWKIRENCEKEYIQEKQNEKMNEEKLRIQDKISRKPGRPKIERTGKKGRPRKIYRVNENDDTEEENRSENDELFIPIQSSHEVGDVLDYQEQEKEGDENMDLDNSSFEDDQDSFCHDRVSLIDCKEIMQSNEANIWKQAIKDELEAHFKNKTFELTNRPKDKNILGCKWVFAEKYDNNGTVIKRKARLVAKGFTQKPGIDFQETFAPVARLSSIRLVIALAVEWKLIIHQIDIVTAFLNSPLEENIYMQIPDYYYEITKQKPKDNQVLYVKRAIYGLKQASNQWHKELDKFLGSIDLKPLKSDNCVYIRNNENFLIIIVYVDDIIIAGKDKDTIEHFKSQLKSKFEIKDMGELHHCLGMEFNIKADGSIIVSQNKYIRDLLQKFNMLDCKPTNTPLAPGTKISKGIVPQNEAEKGEMNNVPYQSLIGSLLYLSITTRPDIAYAVNLLSQYNNAYNKNHWTAAKRILRYLKRTIDKGLVYKRTGRNIEGFADADWGGNLDDRRSFTGYFFKFANSAITWSSRKQRTVALSTAEAEYMSIADAVKEAIYLKMLLTEIGYRTSTITINNDNQSAQCIIKQMSSNARTKHIDIRYHFIKDAVKEKLIHLNYVPSKEMPADIFTKSLTTIHHNQCMEEVGIQS